MQPLAWRRPLAAIVAVLVFWWGGFGTVQARPERESVTNTFRARATLGAGQVFPVTWNCDRSRWKTGTLETGQQTYGIPYTYIAQGKAKGDLPGEFKYEEHAWAFFTSARCPDVDPATLAGSLIGTQEIILRPKQGGKKGIPDVVRMLDTNPDDFRLKLHTVTERDLRSLKRGVLRDLRKIAGKPPFSYYTWTFTSNNGRAYTGYLSGDSQELIITLTFNVSIDD